MRNGLCPELAHAPHLGYRYAPVSQSISIILRVGFLAVPRRLGTGGGRGDAGSRERRASRNRAAFAARACRSASITAFDSRSALSILSLSTRRRPKTASLGLTTQKGRTRENVPDKLNRVLPHLLLIGSARFDARSDVELVSNFWTRRITLEM